METPPRALGLHAPRKGFPLRLDPACHRAIQALASAEFRSANAQIECMLRSRLGRVDPELPVSQAERGAQRKTLSLRLPQALADLLAIQARDASRSLNAHVEMLLAQELVARGAWSAHGQGQGGGSP